ncbi:MAG: ribonuclease HII [Ignavibacteriae bacterium]|nr:MAG: ribonuclease HII [Ignavibacteriota bacterium]
MKQDLRKRTLKLLRHDYNLRKEHTGFLCGVDEAGRGPLAGPVVAAAVIFHDDVYIEGINDSKQVTPDMREKLYEEIVEKCVCFGIGKVDNKEIDDLNIYNATLLAMTTAVSELMQCPELIMADGNFYKNTNTKVLNIVKGDQKSFSIAAASILAKVTRDRIMSGYQEIYPNFSFATHKGYATQAHIEEIRRYGYTDIHRRSFKLKCFEEDQLMEVR